MVELLAAIQGIVLSAVTAMEPMRLCTGEVVSLSPLTIKMGEFTLSGNMLILLGTRGYLKVRDVVYLLRQLGGQRFLVLDKVDYIDGKHATTTPLTVVEFVSKGNQLVYCDNPEDVGTGNLTLHYQFDMPANTPFDVEFYANCYNGGTGRGGIVLKNTSGSRATVTIQGKQEALAKLKPDFRTTEQTARMLKEAIYAEPRTISIANNQAVFVDDTSFAFSSKDDMKLLYCRYHLISDCAITAFVFTGNTKHTLAQILEQPVAPAHDKKTFCGTLGYNTKALKKAFPAAVGTAFLIGEWWHTNSVELNNINEYDPADPKEGGNQYLVGNFGVVYELPFTNAAGKAIRLYPLHSTGEGCILVSVNGSNFECAQFFYGSQIQDDKNPAYWDVPLGSNDTSLVKIIIPGCNATSIKVEVFPFSLKWQAKAVAFTDSLG